MTHWEEIGDGDEAIAYKGVVDSIEGIGGIIKLNTPRLIVKRVNHSSYFEWEGHDIFSRHLAAKIIEAYCIKSGKYHHEHIPVPLGSFSGGYYYDFVDGFEDWDTEREIEEKNEFVGWLSGFGFPMWEDTSCWSGGGSGKNVIFSRYSKEGKLPSDWKRIDFGINSLHFDYKKFESEMTDMKGEFKRIIGEENYFLAFLSGKYGCFERNKMCKEEKDYLEGLVIEFRKSS